MRADSFARFVGIDWSGAVRRRTNPKKGGNEMVGQIIRTVLEHFGVHAASVSAVGLWVLVEKLDAMTVPEAFRSCDSKEGRILGASFGAGA